MGINELGKQLYDKIGKQLYDKIMEELLMAEPPCKHCKFFKPTITTLSNGMYDGVILCIHGDMCSDFSCFREND